MALPTSSSINVAVKARVDIYNGSTLVETCTCSDKLQSFTVDRNEGNNKFFGFGICQALKTELIDLNKELSIEKGFIFNPIIARYENSDYTWEKVFPQFYAEEITRDEDTNSLTITSYDKLYKASSHTVSELSLEAPYSIFDVAVKCAMLLGLNRARTLSISQISGVFTTEYEEGANFSGNETIREVLDAIAEATQTIYYVDETEALVFRRLLKSGGFTISKDNYITLKYGSPITIGAICHATELGDNVISGDENGIIQYIRDNPFWNNRDDIGEIVDAAMAAVEGFTFYEFVCEDWSYSRQLPIGSRVGFEAEDGSYIYSYLLNDTITFDGTLSESSEWTYEANDNETSNNPTSLGEQLNLTYARVDKVNQNVIILTSNVKNQNSRISSIELNTQSIEAKVTEVSEATNEKYQEIDGKYETLSKEVSTKVTSEDVQFTISTELSKGVDKVKTSTGFTFNDEGLNISKSDSEMTTKISEDGMSVSKSNQVVLTANNQGVKAENLHATTYLIIGHNSRIEDWNGRAACFWLGG